MRRCEKVRRYDFGFNNKGSRRFGCQWVFGTELVPLVLFCANEDQIFHVESMCFDIFIESLHVPNLILEENLRNAILVSQNTS